MTTQVAFRRPTFDSKVILTSIFQPIIWFFKAIGEARLTQAQFEAARVIHREYPNEEFNYIFTLLKEGRIGELTLRNKEEIK